MYGLVLGTENLSHYVLLVGGLEVRGTGRLSPSPLVYYLEVSSGCPLSKQYFAAILCLDPVFLT